PMNANMKSAGSNYSNVKYNGIETDVYGNPRNNPSKPTIGAVEPEFEFSISGDFNGGDYNLCGGESRPLSVSIKSELFFAFPNPKVGYKFNNNAVVIKEGSPLVAYGSINVDFDNEIDFTGAPSNSVLKVF